LPGGAPAETLSSARILNQWHDVGRGNAKPQSPTNGKGCNRRNCASSPIRPFVDFDQPTDRIQARAQQYQCRHVKLPTQRCCRRKDPQKDGAKTSRLFDRVIHRQQNPRQPRDYPGQAELLPLHENASNRVAPSPNRRRPEPGSQCPFEKQECSNPCENRLNQLNVCQCRWRGPATEDQKKRRVLREADEWNSCEALRIP